MKSVTPRVGTAMRTSAAVGRVAGWADAAIEYRETIGISGWNSAEYGVDLVCLHDGIHP